MSERKSLDEQITALLEAKKAEAADVQDTEETVDAAEASGSVEESDAKHKRPADKDQKEKEELSKVKQEEKDPEADDDEEEVAEKCEDDYPEDKKDKKKEEAVEEEKDEDEEDKEDDEMKESAPAHKRKADKEQREKADKLDKAKGQDSAQEVDPNNKRAYDYVVAKHDYSVKEDVDALFNGEDLSEEFKTKATTILEAAVNRHIEKILEKVSDDVEQKLAEQDEVRTKSLVEQVSKYLDYVVQEWMEENKLAVERGYAIEATQEFISGLKGLFQEHYIEVPEAPKNVLDELKDENEKLNKDLNEALNRIIDLQQDNSEKEKQQIFSDVTSGLADTQVDKFRELAGNVEFTSSDEYRGQLSTIKENYFPSEQKPAQEIGDSVEGGFEEKKAPSPEMKAYVDALSKTLAHKKM